MLQNVGGSLSSAGDSQNPGVGDDRDNILDNNASAGAGEIGNLATGNNAYNTLSGNTKVIEWGRVCWSTAITPPVPSTAT